MEAPQPPPLSTTASAATVVAPSTYPDSVSSSPRSRLTDSCDADTPPQKLRLMCSYGGHIIPRPHDKTLCYIGGDTRIIVIDRKTSLADLHHRLSKTLLQNQEFSLKYQLPNEDLDSLISVATDEDLENMVEEYDRLNNATRGLKPGRLRLFLFPKLSSIEQILVESASTKSEDWFLNALNGGKATASDRGHSESSSVNCLLGLDDDLLGKSVVVKDVEAQLEGKKSSIDGIGNGNNNNNNSVINQDAHSVPDSPMLETSSSFGSTSSSPSMVNLPPIRVRLEENPKPGVVGMDEHFQQTTVGFGGDPNLTRKKQEEVEGLVAEAPGAVVSGMPLVVGGEYVNRVQSPLQQQQIIYYQLKQGSAVDLASPDSVSSEGSITNTTLSRQRQAIYQEPVRNNRVNINPVERNTRDQNNSSGQMQPQVLESGYVLSSQFDQNHPQLHKQQQFVHTGMQYMPAGAVPIASYYPMYPFQQQHHPHQPLLDQQYPVYFMPARQAQAYNLPVQPPNHNELTPNAPSSRPQMPPPTAASPLGAFNSAGNAASQLEIASGAYRTTVSSAPIRVPISQNQAQYVGFTQVHHPQQAVAPSAPLNSIYEFTDPAHAQMYCTQPLPPQLAAQYQTLAPSPHAMVLPEATAQLPMENLKQQVRTSQP